MPSKVEPVTASAFEGKTLLSADKAKRLGGECTGPGRWIFPDGSEARLVGCEWRAFAAQPKKRRR